MTDQTTTRPDPEVDPVSLTLYGVRGPNGDITWPDADEHILMPDGEWIRGVAGGYYTAADIEAGLGEAVEHYNERVPSTDRVRAVKRTVAYGPAEPVS